LTRQEKDLGDYAGWCPVKTCVLRKIVRTYKNPYRKYNCVGKWDPLQSIDGNGEDSDEEAEVQG
jgi:hypothetical protein